MSAFILTKPRTDFVIVQTWFNIAKYLAVAPFSTECKPQTISLYPLFLMLTYSGATLFSFYKRFFIYEHFNISQKILDVLQGLSEFVFVECVVLFSIVKRNRWRKLIRMMGQFDEKVIWASNTLSADTSVKGLRFRIVLCHVCYVTIHVYDSIANWVVVSYSLAFVIFRITTYYILFATLFITFVCGWTKNRYVYLDNVLKTLTVSKNFKFTIFQKETICEKLMQFSRSYKNMYRIVKEMNAIFGLHFFFIAICTVLEILNAINYGMPTLRQNVTHHNIAVNVLFLIMYVICNAAVVMSCDSVEKSGKNIWKTCLTLYEQVENRELQGELMNLASFIQGLTPEFSAAGFWTVNQPCLSTFFSSVMTYLIIIIQFNITLQ